jgi:hypothetical protein
MDQAGRSFGLMKQVSSLESQVYDLMAKIAHLKDCDSFLVGIIEFACEQWKCKFLEVPWCFWLCSYDLTCLILLHSSGISLNPTNENCRVSAPLEALERTSSGTNTFWIDPRRCNAVVLLQDRVQHVRESVDGCQKSLTTMFSVMLPRNPPLDNFGQLLDVLRTSRRIHRLIELSLIAGANFSLGWIWKWHPRMNFATMSLNLPRSRGSVAL